jgi:hypothetical protein
MFSLLILSTQNKTLLRKFPNEFRLVHRCPFTERIDLLQMTNEVSLDDYVKRHAKERSEWVEK